MYHYQPDIIARTKIPGHCLVHTPFTLKFVPPAAFLGGQAVLAPLIFARGNWTSAMGWAFLGSFLIPAVTAILGGWFSFLQLVRAPLAFAALSVLGYLGGVGCCWIDWLLMLGMNLWFCVY